MSNVFQRVLQKDKKCKAWGCGVIEGLEVHHIIPRSQGGPDEEWNLITLCHKHHNLITTRKKSDIDLLSQIRKRNQFRWAKAFNWHKDKQEIRKLKE